MRFSAPKLADCTQPGPDSELYIVEGDSAARAVLRVRNAANQAVLPMQGKPLNAMNTSANEVHRNVQFAAVLDSLGIELSVNSNAAQLVNVRYERLILLFDPDADGIHARTLMLLFLYRWLRPLLDAGRVFDVHAPQWIIAAAGMPQPVYASTESHLNRVRDYLREQGLTEIKTKRFRGLGGVDALTLKTQCIAPESRNLKPLSAEDADRALIVFAELRVLGREL
ncbi:toprim domain-containing protein [Adhaeretor mobilis]|uniref:DNA topoisomerase (ATP-hydrolyzing) n=1 Tax=Adhaeretor mobilis TaxID=1930276 RepID=A0A517N2N7_9BACT|nr:toprim domain-containing protein [Adhaeretor mobilis]QDT01395.1 DNA gyrase subunit B [Adhaeretor mobilis]